jgi:hypothetical protein
MLKTFIFSFLSYLYLGVLTLFPDLLVIERMFPNCRQPNLDMVVPLQFHLHLTKLCTQFSVVSPPSSQWTRLLYSKAQTCVFDLLDCDEVTGSENWKGYWCVLTIEEVMMRTGAGESSFVCL